MRSLVLGMLLVRALPLPLHATIDPFGARPLMALGRNGSAAATVTLGGYSTRTVVWNAAGGWHLPQPPPFPGADGVAVTVASFDPGGALWLNGEATYESPAIATKYRAFRVAGYERSFPDFSACSYPRNSSGASIDGAYSDGDLIATMQSPPLVDLGDLSGQMAPVVVRLRGGLCTYLGNGVALGIAGTYAAGYAGYAGNVPQSLDAATSRRFVALRWSGDERRTLGPGAAMAVNASGTACGADAPPGPSALFHTTPHARVWPPAGAPVELAPASPLSVCYAVDDAGRAAGMLEDADGRHYAFLWRDGKLERLDDLVRAPDWRFESAYAFGPGGSIAGIGIHRGTAAAFVITGL